MLHRDAREATSYWLQLIVAIGIATLGLVIGSTAVIIAAMLVAPLMTPILGLAMGLATGGPFLVLRSIGRVAGSVIASVAGSAVITWLLPFHELNTELLARTSPTVLDLVTAAFCALAGVYASLRPGSDTVSTAAGTSIGISLVPPLCACGYGIGSADWHVARGAGLLFLTNFVAIVVVGGLAFALLGFGRLDTAKLEHDELAAGTDAPISRAIAGRLAQLFATRAGRTLRLLMPLAFLAAVYVPLVKALDEIGWQVRVKGAVTDALAKSPSPIVQSRSHVEHHAVELSVVILGKPADARALKEQLDRDLRPAAGVAPVIDVYAVADAKAVAGLESSLTAPRLDPPPPPPAPTTSEQLIAARAKIRESIDSVWPLATAGKPLSIDLDLDAEGSFAFRIRHLGAPLGADATEMLRKMLESELQHSVVVSETAIPSAPLTRELGDLVLVGRVTAALRQTSDLERVHVCVTRPVARTRGKPPPADVELARALDELFQASPRAVSVEGKAWQVQFVDGDCPPPSAAPPAPH